MRQSRCVVCTGTHRDIVNVKASGCGTASRHRIVTVLLTDIHRVCAVQNPVIVISPAVSNKHNGIFFRVKMKALRHIERSENRSIMTQFNNNPRHLFPTRVYFWNKNFS